GRSPRTCDVGPSARRRLRRGSCVLLRPHGGGQVGGGYPHHSNVAVELSGAATAGRRRFPVSTRAARCLMAAPSSTTLSGKPHPHVVPEAGERETSTRAALRNPRRLKTEVLADLVVALALIPEAISFSIIAGVDPRVGLFSSFVMAVTIAFVGGRPAMITAATGAVALVIAPVAREYGLDYFIATVLLAG